jgi:RNA polymerase sigma-70 factor (ECF subfamily)
VARTLLAWRGAALRAGGFRLHRAEVNGRPGALLLDATGRPVAVWALEVAEGQVTAVSSVVNPEKLRHLALLRPGTRSGAGP